MKWKVGDELMVRVKVVNVDESDGYYPYLINFGDAARNEWLQEEALDSATLIERPLAVGDHVVWSLRRGTYRISSIDKSRKGREEGPFAWKVTAEEVIARTRAVGSGSSARSAMPSARRVAEVPKTAEAAQANRGGLECSSYTWQVRRRLNAAERPKCQGKPVKGTRPNDDMAIIRMTDSPAVVGLACISDLRRAEKR